MAMFIGIIGMLGIPCCLIWLVVNAIRYDAKKPPLIGMLVCVVLLLAGVGMDSSENEPASPNDVGTRSNISEEDQRRGSSSAKSNGEETVLPTSTGTEASDSDGETKGSLKTGDYQLPCGVKLHFYDSVQNDATGKWRRSGTTSSIPPMDFAVEYYKEMFSSDDEIHSIWNATLNTTTSISTSGGLLFVDTYEYVDGEEQDAKKMFSGMLLDSQIIDLETGAPFEEADLGQELQVIVPSKKSGESSAASASTSSSSEKSPASSAAKPSASTATASSSGSSKTSGGGSSGTWGEDSTTNEVTGSLDRTAYWTSGGKSYHFASDCPSLSRSKNIKTGTLQDAINAGKKDPCNNCANGS